VVRLGDVLHAHVVAEDHLVHGGGQLGAGGVRAQQPHRAIGRDGHDRPVLEPPAEIAPQRGARLARLEVVERVRRHAVEQRQRVAAGQAKRRARGHALKLGARRAWRNLGLRC